MTTQSEFGVVKESLPVVALDASKGYYSGDSVTMVSWVQPCVVCECELPVALRQVSRSTEAVGFWRSVVTRNPLYDAEKECFVVLFLNRKGRVMGWNLVSLGSSNAALAHPREVLRACLVAGAQSFICLHNYPSGDPAPSAADLQVTRMIREAAKAVDIEFADHCIVGEVSADPCGRGFYSFREAGAL